ncbi:MAG: R3H domain-containing nucleic acid-binding protein [Patescibacteria group bacterium]
MLNRDILKEIKDVVEDFFQKMTIEARIEIEVETPQKSTSPEEIFQSEARPAEQEEIPNVLINVNTQEPQLLIGERGQTLNEIQQLLRAILKKKIKEFFFINLDISDYKKKKTEYLKEMARILADEVSLSKKEKWLPPMSSFERRIIHLELAERKDVVTESVGEEPERKILVKPAF